MTSAGLDTTHNGPSRSRPELTAMFQSIINKARSGQTTDTPDTFTVTVTFDGGGLALTPGLGGFFSIPFPCRILGCWMEAGITDADSTTGIGPGQVTLATVYLGLSVVGQWLLGARPIFGASMPTLAGVPEVVLPVDDWVTDLQPYDLLTYTLTSFEGFATILSLTLLIRKIDAIGIGLTELSDGAGGTIVSDGVPVISRGE